MKEHSQGSHPNDRLIQRIQSVVAEQYLENLKVEVKEGMMKKAQQGMYPGRAPYGYRNDKLTHNLMIDAEESRIVKRMFGACGTGRCSSIGSVRDLIHKEFGVRMPNRQVHRILRNPFYTGLFFWGGKTYKGKHPVIVSLQRFRQVQRIGGSK